MTGAALSLKDPLRVQPPASSDDNNGIELRWLEGVPALTTGATWGVPWPRGAFRPDQAFALTTDRGVPIPVQTWPLAFWPDGSLKWTAHAIAPNTGLAETLRLAPGSLAAPPQVVSVRDTGDAIEVDTGVLRCRVGKRGEQVIEAIERDGKRIAEKATLVLLRRDRPETNASGVVRQEAFVGAIESATVEQRGPIRAVIRLDGRHRGANNRSWLPFTLRLYFSAGSDSVRLMHTFVFDGDPEKDFIAGLGVRFAVPMRDALHDRHVRFAGENGGLWAEAVRGLTGLRRDPGAAFRDAQIAGRATPPVAALPDAVRTRLPYIPAWGDYTLSQLSADGFEIRKRTRPGHGWIRADGGRHAPGVGFVGGVSGGVVFGLRDFWQRHPTQLDIRGAAGDAAVVTLWLWSPDAPAMDLRFYHDGMGMDTHAEELQGLEITYEDYERGFGTPVGIARTSEITLWARDTTPSREQMTPIATSVRTPPQVVGAPRHYVATGVFGGLFRLPDRATPARSRIENQLDFLLRFYENQIAQRRWYGFWDYGDVMHSYDADRHVWRYDVGGFAWDNSELSPDLWLWLSFLRSGRADVFRRAEAMTRHTGEVDVYHTGRFRGLGTRHGVQHWGDSAKQVRISTAVYRRFFYYLTGDERAGDLLREQADSDKTFLALDPIRKIRRGAYAPDPHAVAVGFGTDWGSLAVAWLTEWERTGSAHYRDKLRAGMETIAAQPRGFFTGSALMDLDTGRFRIASDDRVSVSHLSAVFGLAEVCAELIELLDVPAFERAWLQYCTLYNADAEEQRRVLGTDLGRLNLGEAHSRLTAYAAWKTRDARLAERAWREFFNGAAGMGVRDTLETRRLEGPDVLNPVDEAPGFSTNAASQWGITAIENLALIGDALPPEGFPTPAGRRGRAGRERPSE